MSTKQSNASPIKPILPAMKNRLFMDEAELLFVRLVIKVFVEVSFSDCVWSQGEAELGRIISEDLCGESVSDRSLRNVVQRMFEINADSSWQEVLEPFMLLEELSSCRAELEAALLKMANIVAKIDGNVTDETMGQLKNLKWQLHQFIKPIDEPQPARQLSARDQQRIADTQAAFAKLGMQADAQSHNRASACNPVSSQS